MRVDETWNDDLAGDDDLGFSLICAAGPTMRSLPMAMSDSTSSPVTRSKKRPPFKTISAGRRPVPWSMRRSSLVVMGILVSGYPSVITEVPDNAL